MRLLKLPLLVLDTDLPLVNSRFFKYLQENDAELLDFDGEGSAAEDSVAGEDASEDGESESDVEMEETGKKGKGKAKEVKVKAVPVLTKEILRSWQKGILEVRYRLSRSGFQRADAEPCLQTRSIRSLRKLLLAFRSAASAGGAEKEGGDRWEIQSATGWSLYFHLPSLP